MFRGRIDTGATGLFSIIRALAQNTRGRSKRNRPCKKDPPPPPVIPPPRPSAPRRPRHPAGPLLAREQLEIAARRCRASLLDQRVEDIGLLAVSGHRARFAPLLAPNRELGTYLGTRWEGAEKPVDEREVGARLRMPPPSSVLCSQPISRSPVLRSHPSRAASLVVHRFQADRGRRFSKCLRKKRRLLRQRISCPFQDVPRAGFNR